MFNVGSADQLLAVPVGVEGMSNWVTITQDMIDRFADATGDHQWIHVDRERAKRELPSRSTIAHGYLTLSLLPQLFDRCWTIRNERQSLNYGGERLRFVSAVPTGSEVRLKTSLSAVSRRQDGGVRANFDCRIEIKGQERPAITLEMLAVFYFEDAQTPETICS
jgi:acyl dehydratase